MTWRDDLALGYHFLAECLASRHQFARQPEPDLVMSDPESVRQYRDAVQPEGNGASVHLVNLLMLAPALRTGMTVVDLACGPATLLIEIARLAPEVRFIGIDLSESMLAVARNLAEESGVHNVEFRRADITRVAGVSDASVDLVMSSLALHHLPTRALLLSCMDEISRMLKPAGQCYLLDFAAFKRQASIQYFVAERTRDLAPMLAQDYEASLRAAHPRADLEAALQTLRVKHPTARSVTTFAVPFFMMLTTLPEPVLSPSLADTVSAYWSRMGHRQRKDFKDLRLFFRLNGLRLPAPWLR